MRLLPVVVVGGGQAGVAASHHLRRRGIEHVVLEQGRVGETWRSQRWDTFVLNTPRWMSRLPGAPEVAFERGAFLSAQAWVSELEAAVRRDEVPVREQTRVIGIRRRRGGGFRVRTEGPSGQTDQACRAVIVASGALNVPRIPVMATSLPSPIQQLNTGTYRRPADLQDGAVLVVGSAQSGVQIAEDLILAGRSVYLATSRVGRVRRRYRGRDMFEWLHMAGWWEHRPHQLPDPDMLSWPNPLTSGVGRQGHTVSLQSLAALGVRLLGRPRSVRGAVIEFEDTLPAAIAFGDQIALDLVRLADRTIAAAGVAAPLAERDVADEPYPDPSAMRGPAALDLDRVGIASVIWTTGFRGDFAYLPADALDAHGAPLHAHGGGSLPGLVYLGLPWLATRKSAIIHGLDEDGAAVVDRVAAMLTGA